MAYCLTDSAIANPASSVTVCDTMGDFRTKFVHCPKFSFRFRDRLAFNMSQSNTFQHKFTYTAPEAKSVLVTGTFDQWSKTQTLTHVADGVFTGTLTIPYNTPGEAIYYKYVVDEQWVTDSKTETKNDESGNLNNVIYAPAEPVKNSTDDTPVAAAAVATGTAATPASAQGHQLPPLFVPPVVLPSDKAAYQEAMAKGDNEVVRPESSNLESFPVVENDVDRTSSPVIVEPPHPQQEPG
ncbi:hypothetical protein INT43_005403 [Umbelopsis isabellina]|uniref:AMP-activated protein kinase glycogen-binding domain-containing protein n=1 Tax=Mortierella isabellina TaxID=91625 RepID=A0A8H7PLY2_MORIS|nr:hypothetical protein INT43_005403 [Umbelopsis isabellina]